MTSDSLLHYRSHRDSSVSSLSEHSLPLGEDTALGSTGVLPRESLVTADVLPRQNDSSSEDDLPGGKFPGEQPDGKGSAGFIPQKELGRKGNEVLRLCTSIF